MVNLAQQAAEFLLQDEYDQAIAIYEECIAADPNVMFNYWMLGLTFLLQGREEEAQACWLSAILSGNSVEIETWTRELIEILETEGIQRLEAGKYEQAERIYLQIIEQVPDRAIAYKNLGNVALHQGKLVEAIAYYQKGIELEPNEAITYYHLAIAFHQLDRLEEAIACYREFLGFNPNDPITLNNLGNALQRQGKFAEAIDCYQKSLALDDTNALAYNNLGTAFNSQGNLAAALACFEQGLILEPNNAESHYNLATFYQEQRLYEKALACCDRAIEINPNYADAYWTRSLILLRLGDYKRGFIEYEWRWQRKENKPRTLSKHIWDGANLAGKTILLQAEQGMGDLIQFIRYVPLLVKLEGCVVVECHPPLVRLLKSVTDIKKVVAIGDRLPEFDVYIPLLSLPRILGTTLETIPAEIPYLKPWESVSLKLEIPSSNCLKVGLVWAGNPEHPSDRQRSCSLQDFLPILNLQNIVFYSLQKGVKSAEINEISCPTNLLDLSSKINDFADTSAVISQLDLVITVDTSVAHLAGALGKRVWVLLCYNADWRWLTEREDSPWYPTMRLFRQNRRGDWQELIERLAQSLQELATNKQG
ncbi:tetratricopeptide repeat protein [Floridanema evergladense]|uniref:Tetratricopeptide repeat protein n=1 Tax=Floridaenema evergladense BLCC-F167 TaxID=3153639 RepID=A0ABV4WFJ2_9CYAN